MKKQK